MIKWRNERCQLMSKKTYFFFLITCPDITRNNVHYTQRNFVIFAKLDFWADPSLNFMLVLHKLCLEFLPPFHPLVNDKIAIFLCLTSFHFSTKNII